MSALFAGFDAAAEDPAGPHPGGPPGEIGRPAQTEAPVKAVFRESAHMPNPQDHGAGGDPVGGFRLARAAVLVGGVASFGGLLTTLVVQTRSPTAVWFATTAVLAAVGGAAAVPLLRAIDHLRERR